MSHEFVRLSRLCLLGRFVATLFSASLTQLSGAAAISSIVVNPADITEGLPVPVALVFDAPICVPVNASSAFSVVQSRVEGNTISVVVAPTDALATCDATRTLAITLPPLSAGTFTIRAIHASVQFVGVLYGNNIIQRPVVTASFTVSAILPPPIKVYAAGGSFGTALSVYDTGAYQEFPVYANDSSSWQSAFYAWPASAIQNYPALRQLHALRYGPNSLRRNFYTLDAAERDRLVASGAFTSLVTPDPGEATFAVIPPTGGLCPSGLTAIYRAYEATAKVHRYAPVSTYRLLTANGWIGDGIAFCVAPEPAGAGSWAPN